MSQASKYLYITGRLRVKETRMFNEVDLERMIDAPSAKEAFRVLNDTDFSDNLLELPEGKLENFQKVLDEELHDVRKFLKQNVPDEHVMRYLALKYNFSNLKILLKEKLFEGAKGEEGSLASVDREFLEQCINYQAPKVKAKRKKVELRDLKLVYHLAVSEVMNYYNSPLRGSYAAKGLADGEATGGSKEGKNPVMIDLILDKHYFAELLRWAKFFGSKFIKDYIICQIDFYNILTFLRIKKDKREQEILEAALIKGGKIAKEEYLAAIEKSLDHFKRKIQQTDYWKNLETGWNFYIQNGEFWMLERDIDNILVRRLKATKKDIPYGPEVAFAYLWGKHNTVRNIRIIMLAKMNGVEPKLIKERVRELY
jgi:V/A-type H+-transporting ATPase subunit C